MFWKPILLLPFLTLAWWILQISSPSWPVLPRIAILPSVFATLLVLIPAILGKLLPDLGGALMAGSLAAALASAVLWMNCRRQNWETEKAGISSWGLLGVGIVALSTFLVGRVAWRFAFHDQLRIQAHPGLIESLLRDNFPPGLMAFPEIPLQYHWGADLVGAIYSYVTGLAGFQAIDLVQISGWLAWMGALYVFCREAGLGRPWTLLALLWVPLGAGWAAYLQPWLTLPGLATAADLDWPSSQLVFGRHLNPGTISNFFMTPYSQGFSLFFAYLALLARYWKKAQPRILVPAALVLGTLSLVQISFFFSLWATTAAISILRPLLQKDFQKKAFLAEVGLLGISLGLAFLLGGFFTFRPEYDSGLLIWNASPGFLKNAGKGPLDFPHAFLWYLAAFGSALLLFIPAAVGALKGVRKNFQPLPIFLLLYAAGSFLVPQIFRYRLTWDIIKWFTGFHIAALLLILLFLSSRAHKKAALALALLLMSLDILPSLRFVGGLAFFNPSRLSPDKQNWWRVVIRPPEEDARLLIQLLKTSSSDRRVWAPYYWSEILARHSGQATAAIDNNTIFFGVSRNVLQNRNETLRSLSESFSMETLRNSRVAWLVFPCQDYEKQFSPSSRAAIEQAIQGGKLKEHPLPSGKNCWKILQLP
jgi:hypothetical protein